MGWTTFYLTFNELEHQFFEHRMNTNIEPNKAFTRFTKLLIELTWPSFFNIKQTRSCSSIGNRIWTPYFWLWWIEHQTSNIVGPITNFLGIFAASTDWARQGVHVGGDQIQVTREKMEQLRRIMEERKAKRRARREARAAPYSTSWSLKSSSTASSEVDAELANLQVKP